MTDPLSSELIALLSKPLGGAEVCSFIKSLSGDPEITRTENEVYYGFKRNGFSLLADGSERLVAVHMHFEREDGYERCVIRMPAGVEIEDRKDDIIDKLGPPSAWGGGGESAIYGLTPQWIRYDLGDYAVHFQFADDGVAIALVTLMTRDMVPSGDSRG